MSKEQMIAKEELNAKLMEIAKQGAAGIIELGKLANVPYDAEMPLPEVITAICKTDRVAKGEEYEYFVVSPETKVVFTIVNGSINQTNVTPGTHNDLTFNDIESDQYYVYLMKILTAKYDALKIKADVAIESLNRKEVKDVLDLLVAAAEGQAKTFANVSGATAISWDKVVEMVESVAKYGDNCVLITGADVTLDVMLMQYRADKNTPVTLAEAGIKQWIKIRSEQYTHSGTQTVLADDKALVVATSDAQNNRCVDFVRRKVAGIDGASEKERVIIMTGPSPIMQVGATPKLAYGIVAVEQYGAVVTNPRCVAVYKDADIYA
jgi:hypothetical protein